MLEQGIKGMIGKGSRDKAVVDSMKKNGVTYFAAVGGAAALISKCVKKYEVIAYPELGPEALAALTVEDFPAIVVIDSEGNNIGVTSRFQSNVPIAVMGYEIPAGRTSIWYEDIVPTLCRILEIPAPNGTTGDAVEF